jgi:hypothetical protein
MRRQHVLALAALGLLVTLGWAACDTGPMRALRLKRLLFSGGAT